MDRSKLDRNHTLNEQMNQPSKEPIESTERLAVVSNYIEPYLVVNLDNNFSL